MWSHRNIEESFHRPLAHPSSKPTLLRLYCKMYWVGVWAGDLSIDILYKFGPSALTNDQQNH